MDLASCDALLPPAHPLSPWRRLDKPYDGATLLTTPTHRYISTGDEEDEVDDDEEEEDEEGDEEEEEEDEEAEGDADAGEKPKNGVKGKATTTATLINRARIADQPAADDRPPVKKRKTAEASTEEVPNGDDAEEEADEEADEEAEDAEADDAAAAPPAKEAVKAATEKAPADAGAEAEPEAVAAGGDDEED
ncbi:ubiquitin-conjugating enzyme [Purpureocillium lavendulum]|uniref:Ubiquitin-conjugating enzyme n=1 Tax=Purpureocillium lavendulum TaxID=1247861 RepID=A0AB34G1V0_9HYPO|nr:ubiquitin-conjugating enzyme [Purpureocillium lavendulum]